MKRRTYGPDRCPACGGPCGPAVDNYGQPYQGCLRCVIVLPEDLRAPQPARNEASGETGKSTES